MFYVEICGAVGGGGAWALLLLTLLLMLPLLLFLLMLASSTSSVFTVGKRLVVGGRTHRFEPQENKRCLILEYDTVAALDGTTTRSWGFRTRP